MTVSKVFKLELTPKDDSKTNKHISINTKRVTSSACWLEKLVLIFTCTGGKESIYRYIKAMHPTKHQLTSAQSLFLAYFVRRLKQSQSPFCYLLDFGWGRTHYFQTYWLYRTLSTLLSTASGIQTLQTSQNLTQTQRCIFAWRLPENGVKPCGACNHHPANAADSAGTSQKNCWGGATRGEAPTKPYTSSK